MENIESLGLSSSEAKKRLKEYGLNEISEETENLVKKLLLPLFSPISLMLIGAAILSLFNGKKFDFYFILFLCFLNYFIQKWQEFKADKAVKQLKNKLAFDVWVLRDNKWAFINAKNLVIGDHIRIGLGMVVPADAKILFSKNLTINEAVLTGESLPKSKKVGDDVFSGSFVATGNFEAEITATGKNTNFGKVVFSIDQSPQKSILEKDILEITRFLTIISLGAVFILTGVFIFKGFPLEDLLTLNLSLIIAGIPIALPAVMAFVLSIGAGGLAKKQVIVRRLSALQDLANVNLLLTDKTGTLTKNEIKITNVISYSDGLSTDDIIELAGYATSRRTPDTIDLAILQKLKDVHIELDNAKVLDFIPYDSERKRTTALIKSHHSKTLISLGAPQIIESFDGVSSKEIMRKFKEDVLLAANDGYRVLALAVKENIKRNDESEEAMKIIGLLYVSDSLDEKSKSTLAFMKENGIGVKVLTGDNKIITQRIVKELGLEGRVFDRKETENFYKNNLLKGKAYDEISAFSEILPNDKYEIVSRSKENFVVAATGDGVNDLPALKVANVGIAVSGAVGALKSLADIVLLGRGLSVIEDAILESRKIFTRLYNYSTYRISESFRLIITILIIGLAYGFYPLVPLQLILLAFLNDIPIISLAVDRVKISDKPSEIKVKERFTLSLLFGLMGVLNSILLFLIMVKYLNLPLPIIQTVFFLKLTVSGHALVFVAHTKERWYKFLPSKEVITATFSTQIIATLLAMTGFLMPSKISIGPVILVWLWAFLWMQISELMKDLQIKLLGLSRNHSS